MLGSWGLGGLEVAEVEERLAELAASYRSAGDDDSD